jgi:hypothetical protein
MYSGPVPAIAELIANAWDAEAHNVEITIPLGTEITRDSVILVKDDGHGMSFDEVDDEYLVVGRDRRKSEGEMTKGKKRRLMAHKGIGKLAAFGIARVVTVRTTKNGRRTSFTMDYGDIVKDEQFVRDYEPRDTSVEITKDPDGTEIILADITVERAISADRFMKSMSRRFAVYSDDFKVVVNGQPIVKAEAPWQFRYPEEGWQEETLDGGRAIRWWFGFAKEPIPDEEFRGVSVLARGRLVQTPWFFGLSGGMHGQHGMQYLTGEVQADFLDEGDEDLVATDRGSALWEHPKAKSLQEWGQRKIKELLNKWADRRAESRLERIRRQPPLWSRIEKFRGRERAELQAAITKLAGIETIDDQRLDELVTFLLNAYENKHFMDVIRQLNAASAEAQAEVLEILAEWDVLEAVATAQVVRGRLAIISKFEQMIDHRVREKPDMQELLRDHPWLIDPTWTLVAHEKRLETLLVEYFHTPKQGQGNRRRVDFFCLADSMRVIVVEVKRPGDLASKGELRQLIDYVDYLREQEGDTTDRERPARSVYGYLVSGGLEPEARRESDRMQRDDMFVRTWERLLTTARESHRHFLEIVKQRAPRDDPRILALEDSQSAPQRDDVAPTVRPRPTRAAGPRRVARRRRVPNSRRGRPRR